VPDGLTLAEFGLALVLLAGLAFVLYIVGRRRWLSSQGWVFDCSLRDLTTTPSTGWVLGVARLNGEAVEWYRVLSMSLRPKRIMERRAVQVVATRAAAAHERAVLYDQQRIAEVHGEGLAVELAMAEAPMTAFLAWMEAAPPGGRGYR